MGKPLVIVESPAKARTIGKFLGGDYVVEASIGHVRDLPSKAAEIPPGKKKEPWARLGVNVDADFEPLYVVPAEKKNQVKKLKEAMEGASALYLATDEDREGESISWHLLEVLRPKIPVHRLVFHEITRAAIEKALANPRELDVALVRAQETRRILDRLYGYEVSPLLWKKIRPELSAGRVQSVAVRLLVQRERQRIAFKSAPWWDVGGRFQANPGELEAALASWNGVRLASGRDFEEDGSLKAQKESVLVLDEAAARAVVAELEGVAGRVLSTEEKPYRDRPAAPFTTSTLQQEGNRKLRWTARRTMQVAQRLYETGWITYMRTDSTTLSDEAIAAARSLIREQYGSPYLPGKPRVYESKVKNAQEAHEAVRPAGTRFRSLEDGERELDEDAARLYALIWKRTVACQMEDARGRSMTVQIEAGPGRFVARGRTVDFPGYRRAYVEDSDTPEADLAERERVLPPVQQGEQLPLMGLDPKGHQTQPPARLTEASLVKELEARGIGRPSTYASIIDTIQRRDYVFKKGTALVPTFTAFAVTDLLEQNLGWLVDYDFTARMEEQLDEVALGHAGAKAFLARFYRGAEGLKEQLELVLDRVDPRAACTMPIGSGKDGPIEVRVGRYGPFLQCGDVKADVPGDLPPDELTVEKATELLEKKKEGPRDLGLDPATGLKVYLMEGRFGPYVQLGEVSDEPKAPRPKTQSLLKTMSSDDVGLEVALSLLSLPRELGIFPDNNEMITATNGRYGPYVKAGDQTRSIPATGDVLKITADEAIVLLRQPARRRGPEPLREVGVDPSTGRNLILMSGRFGPYVTDGETNASLRKGMTPENLELSTAIGLIRDREQAPKRPPRGKSAAKGGAAAKTGTKKAATAKAPAAPKKAAAAKGTTKAKKAATKTTKSKATGATKSTSRKAASATAAEAVEASATPTKTVVRKKAAAKKG